MYHNRATMKTTARRLSAHRNRVSRSSMSHGKIIPPLSVVRLMRADKHTPRWKDQIGRIFRVGYYSRQDGIDCVWLVNEDGKYEQSADQASFRDYFEVVE